MPLPENQEKIIAVTLPDSFTALTEGCSEKQTFLICSWGFWRSLRGLAHTSTKLPTPWKVVELAKVLCGQLCQFWDLGRRGGGCDSRRQAGRSNSCDEREPGRSAQSWSALPGHSKNLDLVFSLTGKSKLRSCGYQRFSALLCRSCWVWSKFCCGTVVSNFCKVSASSLPFTSPFGHFRTSQFWFTDFTTLFPLIVGKSDGDFISIAISAVGDGQKVNTH